MNITIDKQLIYAQVAKTTLYVGAKLPETDVATLKRIATIDDDTLQLNAYLNDAIAHAASAMRRVLADLDNNDSQVNFNLALSQSFDPAQAPALRDSLISFLVNAVIAKWFAVANKSEAAEYAQLSAASLDEVLRKAYFKRKPSRPNYHSAY